MDNFLEEDINTFIFNKSLKIFQKINKIELNQEDIIIDKFPLSGISNTIFKVEIKYKDSSNDHDNSSLTNQLPTKIPINHLFFKVFGRISVLVDRELETFLMTKLSENNLGPKIYETDGKTYRIEEYYDGFTVLKANMMLDKKIISKMNRNFSKLNIIPEDSIEYYSKLIGNKKKSEFFILLRDEDKMTNIIKFILKKMKPLADKSFCQFKEKFVNDINLNINGDLSHLQEKINHVEFTLNNLENLLYEICPDTGIFVIGHNDSHPLNILLKSDFSEVLLCDYEYSSFNFLGFDIANYLIESCYYLSAENFPFYEFYRENMKVLENGEGYKYFLEFFELFENENSEILKSYSNFGELIEQSKTRDYYYRLMGISSLLWFGFAVIYYDYDSFKNKSGYDYLGFSLDRLLIYDKIVKPKVEENN